MSDREKEAAFLPNAADLQRRKALAKVMRYWLSRDGQLLQPEVMGEIHARCWEDQLTHDEVTASDPLFDNAYHLLWHYFSDQDVREMVPGYKKCQLDGMKSYIEKLEGRSN